MEHHLMLPPSALFVYHYLKQCCLLQDKVFPVFEELLDENVVMLPYSIPLPQSTLLVGLRLPCGG